jgi:hypothetical protein
MARPGSPGRGGFERFRPARSVSACRTPSKICLLPVHAAALLVDVPKSFVTEAIDRSETALAEIRHVL